MATLHPTKSLKTKLSLLVTMAVMLVVTALGFYFDGFIKDGFLETTRIRMLHGYERLSDNIRDIERDLKEGVSFIRTDEGMIASIDLINKYEDKDNYNVFLIDEEKKSIANQLLSRVKLSFNNDIVLYGKNQELVAFATKDRGGYRQGFISYKGGEPQLYWRYEHQRDYVAGDYELTSNISIKHKNYYDPNQLFQESLVTYQRLTERLAIKSHQSIFESGSGGVIGHIELSKILGEEYFNQLSRELDLDIQHTYDEFDNRLVDILKDSVESETLKIQQTDLHYITVAKKEIHDDTIYFVVKLNKVILNSLLNSSRFQFLLILILITLSTLVLMRYILNRGLDSPLTALMEQIHKIENMDYSKSTPLSTGDELEDISVNINRLAQTVQEREESLKSSMEEQRYLSSQVRMLLDSTAEAIYGLDLQGNCTFANPACAQLLGLRSVDELLGRNMHQLTHHTRSNGDDYPEAQCPIFNVFRTGAGIHIDNEVLWRKDGSSFQAEYWSYPIRYNDEITGAVVTFLDITERKIAEEGLRRTKKMDAIGQLSGGIAHDFNNILGVILGNLEMLERKLTMDETTAKRISSMKKAGHRAADLTKQLLSFSRNKSGDSAVTDINQVIKGMDNLIERSLTPEVEVKTYFDEYLWRTEIDPGDFEDALLNLCINARDAMKGYGFLTIETRNTLLGSTYCSKNLGVKPGEYVELTVSDSGSGITAEEMEHIFEPFFTTKEQGKGTGLGLSMVFGFVKRAGGHIRCHSEVGIGTTFRLFMPRSLRDMDMTHSDVVAPLPKGRETILAVDDDIGVLELAQELLEGQGYRVITASSGKQALEKIAESKEKIDLLFSDVVMPGGTNGYELAEQATTNQPDLKVLLTSGYTKVELIKNSQLRFSASLLNKPYTLTELSQRIRLLLNDRDRDDAAVAAASEGGKESSQLSPVKWSDAFSVGVEAIDEDHRQILRILNASKQAAHLNDDSQCSILLERLMDYTQTHFRREEVVMATCGYLGIDNHIQAHQILTKAVENMQVQLSNGDLHISEMAGFISDWLYDHILYMDRAFASFCLGKEEEIELVLKKAGPAPGERYQA